MATFSFSGRFAKNQHALSVHEFLSMFFFGQSINDPKTGQVIPDEDIRSFIHIAMQRVEQDLNLKLLRQIVDESQDLVRRENLSVIEVATNYWINGLVSVEGQSNNETIAVYPNTLWNITIAQQATQYLKKRFYFSPRANAAIPLSFFWGYFPYMAYYGNVIPNFWRVKYDTGFRGKVPMNVLNYLAKLAVQNLYNIFDNVGYGAGLASSSISFDGFSQSINTTQSSTSGVYGASLTNLSKQLPLELEKLQTLYVGNSYYCT